MYIINNLLLSIDNFFFNYYVSSTFIGIYRILIISTITGYLLLIYKDIINFSNPYGIFNISEYRKLCKRNMQTKDIFYNYNLNNYIVIYLLYFSAFLSIIGFLTNISILIFIFCLNLLQHRVSIILSSGGDVIANVILWSLFMIDCGAGVSIDSFLFNKNEYIQAWSFRLIQITMSFGFMSAGLIKMQSKSWQKGLALRNSIFYTPWGKDRFKNLFKYKLVYIPANYFVVFYQVIAPILFWTPKLTILGIIFGVFLHFMMLLSLKIGYFAPVTIIGVLSFMANYFVK